MNIRGYFMLLMSTIWRTVVTQLLATFRYRLAGGSDNALLPESNGRAVFDKIYGNTVKWNQLVSTIHYTGTAVDNTYRSAGTPTVIINHYYYFRLIGYGWYKQRMRNSAQGYNLYEGTTNAIVLSDYTGTCLLGFRTNIGDYDVYSNLFDLTSNFGTDAEIAAALGITTSQITQAEGVAAFEAWLALNGGAQDYYPYDEGSLVSFKGQGVKSVGWNKFHVVNGSGVADVKKDVKYYVAGPFGSLHYSDGTAISVASDRTFTAIKDDTITFGSVSNSIVLNIYTGTAKDGTYEPYHEEIVDLSGAYINVWDEMWDVGSLNASTGADLNDGTQAVRSKNYIPVSGQTYIKCPTNMVICGYDSNKNFVGSVSPSSYSGAFVSVGYYTPNNVLNVPSSVKYIRFRTFASYGSTYNHNICINVSNANINGTYFPHALQSAGSVTDEDTATELTKNLIEVDLGSLTYSPIVHMFGGAKASSGFEATISNLVKNYETNKIPNIECYLYDPASVLQMYNGQVSKGIVTRNNQVYIADSSAGNDPAAFKSAVTGYKFIVELATPIIIPHDTPMQYAVDKYSTEEVIVPASVAGEPTSTALVADIEYQAK